MVVVRFLLIATSFGLLVSSCSQPPLQQISGTEVHTRSGVVTAYQAPNEILQWSDIPYAQPPVGDMRWKAPRELNAAESIITPKPTPVMCAQPGSEYVEGAAGTPVIGQEDCLYLDVLAPSFDRSVRKPVMVWIHGGGNTTGHKSNYDFSKLVASQNVIVVALNYRLGALGWISHPAIQGEGAVENAVGIDKLDKTSNFGTLDLIAGLQWVRDNITAFGGDASNVTVFGESAGGHNIYALLSSPQARPLFDKAIVQSGYTTTVTPTEGFNKAGVFPHIGRGSWNVFSALGFDNDTVTGSVLRSLSAESIITAYESLPNDHREPLTTADGIVIPEGGILAALRALGPEDAIPVMAGTNKDEVTLWLGRNRYFVDVSYPLTKWGPPMLELVDPKLYANWVATRSRAWKLRGVDTPLHALAEVGFTDLYAYRFDWDETDDSVFAEFSSLLGAPHAAEIAFLIGRPMYGPIGDYMYPESASAESTTKMMMTAWANFAKVGNPGEPVGITWPRFSQRAPHYLHLDTPESVKLSLEDMTFDELVNNIASIEGFSPTERCLLLWESLVNIGLPKYGDYTRWNDGACADVDAVGEKLAIKSALEAEFGTAKVF